MSELTAPYAEKMDKTLSFLKGDFASIRAGRANPAILDKLVVDYYGTPTPINQMASLSVAEARVLVIQPYDASILRSIEKAIQASDIGINPTNDGRIIRLVFPQLTEERRKDLVKQIRKMGEDAKVAIRSIRRDAIDKFEKDQKAAALTEDDLKIAKNDVQKLTDDRCKQVDELMQIKEKELLEL